jgi:hypothetical protein
MYNSASSRTWEIDMAVLATLPVGQVPMDCCCVASLTCPSAADYCAQVQVGGGPEPPKSRQREDRQDDFYANVGDAIRTLREDVPTLFSKELNCAPYCSLD